MKTPKLKTPQMKPVQTFTRAQPVTFSAVPAWKARGVLVVSAPPVARAGADDHKQFKSVGV